jgi:hypothetical protein
MANPIEELLKLDYSVPDDDDTIPAFLETSGGNFISIGEASKAQVRLAAKLHREIARRHALLADKLDEFARGDSRLK